MLKRKIKKNFIIAFGIILIAQILFLYPKEDIKYNEIGLIPNLYSIYVLDDNNYLSEVKVALINEDINTKIEELFNYLKLNSSESNKLRNGFISTIPSNIKLSSYDLKDKVLTLNFNKDFINLKNSDIELIVKSLTYTFTSLSEIKSIDIYVDGKVYLENLNRNNLDINSNYNINSVFGISSVKINYLAKKDGNYYNIPVTNISNSDNKDKTQIIIEELKSASSYNSNIVQVLSDATELTSFEINDSSLILNFNKNFFGDIENTKIKEEVTYTIASSFKDNYDVDLIVLLCDNQQIAKYSYS